MRYMDHTVTLLLLCPAVSGSCLQCAHAHLTLFPLHLPALPSLISMHANSLFPTMHANNLFTTAHSFSTSLRVTCSHPCVPLRSLFPTHASPSLPHVPQVVKAGVNAGKLAGAMARVCGGGGGGRPNFAQAGGRQPEKLSEALAVGRAELMKQLGA
ncbi:unnamed protein product [Closterium sp. Naga37s-1]|nr:unnamed protein product [Closterium sp. Naga37s-1]